MLSSIITCGRRIWENSYSLASPVGVKINTTTLKVNWQYLLKLKTCLPADPSLFHYLSQTLFVRFVFVRNIYKTLTKKEAGTKMPLMAWLYKQNLETNKCNHIYIYQWQNDQITGNTFILEYYAPVKRNDVALYVTTWIDSKIYCWVKKEQVTE